MSSSRLCYIQAADVDVVVYLYLVNYGRSRPEEVTSAISGFLSVSRSRHRRTASCSCQVGVDVGLCFTRIVPTAIPSSVA